MAAVDARIGDEIALRSKPNTYALGDPRQLGGERRPDGAVEDPQGLEALPAQQRHQPDQIEAALQLGAGVLEIKRAGNRRLA